MTPTRMTTALDIRIRRQNNFGRIVAYPASPDAQMLAAIAGTKTLTHGTLMRLNQFGQVICDEAGYVTGYADVE
jgi:hypothetical protein